MQVAFIGFTREELDTLKMYKFEPGSFQQAIDSTIRIFSAPDRDTFQFGMSDVDHLDLSKNYEIVLTNIPRSYRLSEIKTRKHDCTCGHKDGKTLTAYNLDGENFIGEVVYMEK
jgi:hypothetical protein